jgi:hypothetical protein
LPLGIPVRALDATVGTDPESFAAYAFYVDDQISKLALVNVEPYYVNSTFEFSVGVDLSLLANADNNSCIHAKRLTAPLINTSNNSLTTWAGQSFPMGDSKGEMGIETVNDNAIVSVRGSEALLIYFHDNVYGW